MSHQVSISGVTGTPPYSISVCDTTLVYCYLITGSTTIPPTFTFDIPSPLDVAESVIVKVTDSNGCQIFYKLNCPIIPTCIILGENDEILITENNEILVVENCVFVTPTPTPSSTPTSLCRCIQIVNTGTTSGKFYYTQCDGTITSVLPINSGTTLYYCGSNPVALTECVVYIGENCVNNSCVAITPTPTPTPTITPSPSSP